MTKEELNNRINLRQAVHDKLAYLKTSGLSNNKIGPMIAGVYDPQTGKYYFGTNDYKGYIPSNLHPTLVDRYTNMPQDILESYGRTKGVGSHAEIYALNEALWARENAGLSVNMEDLYLNVITTKRISNSLPVAGMPAPRCPHCAYLTNGTKYYPEVLKYGKNGN